MSSQDQKADVKRLEAMMPRHGIGTAGRHHGYDHDMDVTDKS